MDDANDEKVEENGKADFALAAEEGREGEDGTGEEEEEEEAKEERGGGEGEGSRTGGVD
jgi:hypothetical protein